MTYLRALVPTIHRMLACRNSHEATRTARSALLSASSAACRLHRALRHGTSVCHSYKWG